MDDRKYNILLVNHVWFKQELIDLGHNVITSGWLNCGYDIVFPWRCPSTKLIEKIPDGINIDCLIYYDDSGLPSISDIENLPFKKIFYSVDTHHHIDWHKEFARLFEVVLLAQKSFINDFKLEHLSEKVNWFPPWPTINIEPSEIRTIDVSFRGTMDEGLHPGRKNFLEYCSNYVNLDFGQGDYVEVYSKSKIVINEAVRGDLNFRVFEAIMSGALLLNPRINNGLEDIFQDGTHYVAYSDGDAENAISLIKYYLENEEERLRIANCGREKLLAEHTSIKRALKLNEYIHTAINSKETVNKKVSISMHSSILRYLWLFTRKYGRQNMMPHLLQAILDLQTQIISKNVDFSDTQSCREVSILIIDSLLNDILDTNSYLQWLENLKNSEANLLICSQLYQAFSTESELLDHETKISLNEVFSNNRKNFIDGLLSLPN